jgi:gentisate 1,2-dioxygenase
MILSNPAVYPKHYSTNTLYLSCSIYNPGEVASVHRHTPNASRFVLEGQGGYTTIEGEKCTMHRGDLIITPNGTWHDHGNEGDEPVLWVDVLDLPLVETLGATKFEFEYTEPAGDRSNSQDRIRKNVQTVTLASDYSTNVYGAGGLMPTFIDHQRGTSLGTPMLVYRWKDAEAALNRLRDYAGSPYDGIMLEYKNPVNGDPVTTTMSFHVQLLRPGERTKSHRHTSSTGYCCLFGRGKTIVDGREMEWTRNDMFVVPSWAPHEHVNLNAGEDAILYSVSDAPTLKKLGLYREEAVS